MGGEERYRGEDSGGVGKVGDGDQAAQIAIYKINK